MNLIKWIASRYDIVAIETTPSTDPIDFMKDFAGKFLLRQAHAILHYKRRAEEQNMLGVRNCKAVDVQRQLLLLFTDKFNDYGAFNFEDPDLSLYDSFGFGDYNWRVSEKANHLHFQGIVTYHFLLLYLLFGLQRLILFFWEPPKETPCFMMAC